MNRRQVLDIIFITFGLYLLVAFCVRILPSFLFVMLQEKSPLMGDINISKGAQVFMCVVQSMAVLALAGLFLLKRNILIIFLTRDSADINAGSTEREPCYARPAFWIQIFGLYYFIETVVKFGQMLVSNAIIRSSCDSLPLTWWLNNAGHYLVAGVLSVVFIWKSEAIAKFIRKISS